MFEDELPHIDASVGNPLFEMKAALRRAMAKVADNKNTPNYYFNSYQSHSKSPVHDAIENIYGYFKERVKAHGYDSFMPIDGGTSRAFHLILQYLASESDKMNTGTKHHNRLYGYHLPVIKPVIIIPVPTYGHFLQTAKIQEGIEVITIRRRREHGWDIDTAELDALIEQLHTQGKYVVAFYDCAPHNPTGYIRDEQATRELATVIKKHSDIYVAERLHMRNEGEKTNPNHKRRGRVLWDYPVDHIRVIDDIVYDGHEYEGHAKAFPFAAIPEMTDACFTLAGLSKMGFAGLRAGLVIGNGDDLSELRKMDANQGYAPSVATLESLSAVFSESAQSTKWRTDYFAKANTYYRYAGLLLKTLINGLGTMGDEVDTATVARMKRDICKVKKCSPKEAMNLLTSGIDGVSVVTSPDSGFFHLVDFSAFKGRRYEHRYNIGEHAYVFKDEMDVQARLLPKFNLATASGNYTGLPVEDCIRRVSFAFKPDILIAMADRLRGITQSFLPNTPNDIGDGPP